MSIGKRLAWTAGAVGLAVSVFAGAPMLADRASAENGVCLSQPLQFADGTVSGCLAPGEIEALLDRRVALGPNRSVEGLTVTHPTDFNQQRKVGTCREYERASAEGWYALSTFDMAMESYFKRECGTLRSMARAARARSSFLDRPAPGLQGFDQLSASVLSPLLGEGRGTVGDLVRAGRLTIAEQGTRALKLEAAGARGELTEIARGDFDGDGIEDILAFCAVHAEGGSYRSYDLMVLSRRTAGGPLEVVMTPEAG